MKKMINLPFINNLERSLSSSSPLIQVILGPRQVGKTTGILQFCKKLRKKDYHYASADGNVAKSDEWLHQQWVTLASKAASGTLIIDEIQKVENWSEKIKEIWDRQKRQKEKIRVILLGSSSLDIQKGLRESLTGRFILHKVYQWNFEESKKAYGIDYEDFLRFGGYPGSYPLLDNEIQWLSYVKESIIDTVIGKDILSLARVKSPALFRQCFDLASSYGGQEISYTKMLGQLQDKGNVELVKHYLELFEGVFLLKQLFKFSNKDVLRRSSSPKILPLCPAIFSITKDADLDQELRGRAFEIAIGCELLRLPGQLYYWREGKYEVDYIYQFGRKTIAIEVKSGRKKSKRGLAAFNKRFSCESFIITPENKNEILKKLS